MMAKSSPGSSLMILIAAGSPVFLSLACVRINQRSVLQITRGDMDNLRIMFLTFQLKDIL